ncbi:MAG: branched-chain amino acid ABC transporter permease [Parvibaculaceae bacterium]
MAAPPRPRAARSITACFDGPQTLGRGPLFWICVAGLVALMALVPEFVSRYQLISFSNFLISGLLALSLCLIWGYCGILSLGQSAFFCIGGYAYGVLAINLISTQGNTHVALLGGILVPCLAAIVIGAVLFYSRIRGVTIAILMLVLSLLLGLFMRQTADPFYTIGAAALGGMNGLRPASPSDPLLPSLIFGFGGNVLELDGRSVAFYYFMLAVVVVVFLALRWFVNSTWGYVFLGVREDPERTEAFGYDVRLVQLVAFAISAALAGLSGTLYTAWGTFIHPDGFSVAPNILVVIWVAVGGRKDLGSALLGAFVLNWLSLWLTQYGEYSMFVLGAILIASMLVAPDGVFYTLGKAIEKRFGRLRGRTAPVRAPDKERRHAV